MYNFSANILSAASSLLPITPRQSVEADGPVKPPSILVVDTEVCHILSWGRGILNSLN